MHLKFVRSGGIAGLKMEAAVDAAELPAGQQGVVSRLLTEELKGNGASPSRGADQYSYQLEIHHGDQTIRRDWQDSEVDESVRPLLAELTRKATPTR